MFITVLVCSWKQIIGVGALFEGTSIFRRESGIHPSNPSLQMCTHSQSP